MRQMMALLPVLSKIANGPNGTASLRNMVRALRGSGS
jgi:hypothetical protein